MRVLFQFIRRYGLFPPLLIMMVLAVGGLAYLAATLGVNRDGVRVFGTAVVVSPAPDIGTPNAPFAGVDPNLLPYSEAGQRTTGLQIDNSGIPPVGAYLPREGNSQFQLAQPTALPTPLRYPTSPPLPYPTSPPLPTQPIIDILIPPTATSELVATVLAFGTNVAPVNPAYIVGMECAPTGLPVDGILTQRFHAYHSGIDLGIPLGTAVYATQSGTVTWAEWNTFGYGNLVIIQSGRFITYYAHLTSPNVIKGDVVAKGSLIGWSGSTGNSSGPHVHYETRVDDIPNDPLTFESQGYPTC